MHVTLKIIREEHAALAAMLRSLVLLLAEHRRTRTSPDFAALRAMLFYLDEFPEQRHHRKEIELLFPKLRARTPLAREQLDRLDAEHARGERAVSTPVRAADLTTIGTRVQGGTNAKAGWQGDLGAV